VLGELEEVCGHLAALAGEEARGVVGEVVAVVVEHVVALQVVRRAQLLLQEPEDRLKAGGEGER
jgi:hypothetical protein